MSPHHRRHDRRSFYKYLTADAASAVLASHCLRWRSPLGFNDPFDVPRSVDLAFTPEMLLAALEREFVRVVNSDETPADPSIRELVTLLRANPDPVATSAVARTMASSPLRHVIPTQLAEFREAWSALVPNLRILCLSEIHDSTLMWAHYAGAGSGAVLEFACSDELDSASLVARPIVYQPGLPALPGIETWVRAIFGHIQVDWHEFLAELYYVKGGEWSYEREWRIVSYSPLAERDGYTDMRFHPRELEAVYLGPAISETNALRFRGLCEGDCAHVRLSQGRHDYAERKIVFDLVR